jgi:TM2 domain-containing membrane protein YozV
MLLGSDRTEFYVSAKTSLGTSLKINTNSTKENQMAFCASCGSATNGTGFCGNCGAAIGGAPVTQMQYQNQPMAYGAPVDNKKVTAGVCALLLGGLGIHKFILGYKNEGIIQIVITIFTCGIGGIIPFIEGIIYPTKSDQEFYNTYQVNKKAWF